MTPDQTEISLTLGWPPSVNRYWRNVGHRVLISKAGRAYRLQTMERVQAARAAVRLPGRLSVHILAYPPDRRKRDLDNVLKSLLDALQHGGVYQDDSQIDRIEITRGPVGQGEVEVTITCRL